MAANYNVRFGRMALDMKRDWPTKLWRSSRQYLLGGVSLALLTFVCFRLGLSLAATGFAYLILIALLSLRGSVIGSLALAIAAVGCLNYFFTEPLFSFRVEYPQDVLGLIAFSTTAIIIARLTAMARKTSEEVQSSQKALIDTMPAHVWSALPDGSHDFHSRRWLEFSGLSAAEAAGDGWIATFHPDDRAKVVDKWRTAVATGEPFEAEARRRSANGEYHAFLGQARPLRDERGNIVKWCGSSTDLEDVKRAMEALRESEAQWREVFEHNPAMYFMVDAAGAVLSVNAFGAAQLGYTVGELVGQSVLNVFFEEDRDFVQRNLAVCLEKLGQSNSWEVRKVRKDGATIWVRESAKAVRRANDRLIVLIACEDITERKRTENALRQSEMYLAEAQRISRTGSFGWSVADGEIIWSEETFRIFEYDRAVKPTLELVLQRIHPEDRAPAREFLERVLEEGKDFEFEHRLLMPDGSVRHLRTAAHAVKDASGKLEFIGAVMDQTAAKQAEVALRQSEMYLAEAQKISRTGSFRWSVASDEIEIMWSEESYRILEIDRTVKPTLELVFERTHPEDRASFRRFVEKALQEGKDWDSERRLLMPDGSVKHVRAAAHAVKDASGKLEFLGALMDVTAARRAQEELLEAQAELARVIRVTTLGELSAAIAHEVSQPLTGVVSSGNACLRWLAGETPNLELARRAVERMINDGARAGEVLSRIRALVRKSPPQRDYLNVNDAIMEVIALIRSEVQRNRISLKTELSNDLPLVLADRVQLQQVILNLMTNAIEAMSGIAGGQRELSLASVNDGSNAVLVTVRDSGPGLGRTALERLFEAFYTTKSDGMGMGLAISRRIIEAHGGKLWATPNAPQGAIFQFTLPADDQQAPSS